MPNNQPNNVEQDNRENSQPRTTSLVCPNVREERERARRARLPPETVGDIARNLFGGPPPPANNLSREQA